MASIGPKQIAHEAGMDFKSVRRLLRKHYGRQHKQWHKWQFTEDEARDIVHWLTTRRKYSPGN